MKTEKKEKKKENKKKMEDASSLYYKMSYCVEYVRIHRRW